MTSKKKKTELANRDKAIAEAVRRWGVRGAVAQDGSKYAVGTKRMGKFYIYGIGNSWTAAFADADKVKS